MLEKLNQKYIFDVQQTSMRTISVFLQNMKQKIILSKSVTREKHCWNSMSSCVIFHKHKVSDPYHQHGYSSTLLRAVRQIKKHDKWQLGRRE